MPVERLGMTTDLKIVFIVFELGFGGQERQMSYALQEFKKSGYGVELVVWNPAKKENTKAYGIGSMGIKITFLEGGLRSKLRGLYRVIRQSEDKIDVVQSWSMPVNFFSAIVCSLAKVPFIGAYRSNFSWAMGSASIKERIKIGLNCWAPKELVCNSKISKEQLYAFRKKFFRYGNVHYISNRLLLPAKTASIGGDVKIKSISVGSLQAYKRWDFIIDVIYKLKQNGIEIIHRHAGHNGELKEFLENKVKELDLTENFIFLGQLNNLESEYCDSQILFHASEVEGTPNAVIEAMSHGLPVFTSNCGDVKYLVNQENGHVFSDYDLDHWCSIIKDSVVNCSLSSMGQASRKKAEALFDIRFLRNDLFKIYNQIVNRTSTSN